MSDEIDDRDSQTCYYDKWISSLLSLPNGFYIVFPKDWDALAWKIGSSINYATDFVTLTNWIKIGHFWWQRIQPI